MTKEISLKMPMSRKQTVYQKTAVESFHMVKRESVLSSYTKKEKISPYYYKKSIYCFHNI